MSAHLPSEIIDAVRLTVGESPSPMLLFGVDEDITLLFSNASHAAMTGAPTEAIVGRPMFEAFAPDPGADEGNAEQNIRDVVKRIVSTGEPTPLEELQHNLPRADGTYEPRHWAVVHWPIKQDGRVVAILQRSQDVTEQVRNRVLVQTLREAAERSAGITFFSYDPATDRFDRSPEVDRMFGFAASEAGANAAPFFERVHPDDLPGVHEEVGRAMEGGPGSPASFDYRVILPDTGETRHVRVRAGIELDPDDGKTKMFGVFVDMSDIEQARSELAELSDRNAALVVESHHRIKNSLAIASAMLSQQMRSSEDPAVQDALRLAATRIAAISDVHGELFKDAGVKVVDAGSLVEQFANSFSRTIGNDDNGSCRIAVETQKVMLPSRYAVTLTLTLNELLTNAVKYGMNAAGECKLDVLLKEEGGIVTLCVANTVTADRVGDIVSHGVGSRLIVAFARQLNGEIATDQPGDRFEVRFTFPLPEEKSAN